MSDQKKKNVKLVIIGDDGVGKTCLQLSYEDNSFPGEYIPTCRSNNNKILTCGNFSISLGIWDTNGKEEYDSLRSLIYPQTDVFLICFSLVDMSTLQHTKSKWIPEARKHCTEDTQIILVGTKLDLQGTETGTSENKNKEEMEQSTEKEPVPSSKGWEICEQFDLYDYRECSSKTQRGLKEVFDEAIRSVLEKDGTLKQRKKKKREKNGRKGRKI